MGLWDATKNAVSSVWEGTKSVGKAIKENPGHAIVGGTVGLIVGGPVGMVVGAGAGGWVGEKNQPKDDQNSDKAK